MTTIVDNFTHQEWLDAGKCASTCIVAKNHSNRITLWCNGFVDHDGSHWSIEPGHTWQDMAKEKL